MILIKEMIKEKLLRIVKVIMLKMMMEHFLCVSMIGGVFLSIYFNVLIFLMIGRDKESGGIGMKIIVQECPKNQINPKLILLLKILSIL